ncbi:MAG: hypothetical protein IJU71_09880 [Selenomonadaceae bacterium]|nr:hypothetical protein [Selenomonadaceae bacterium]
MSDYEKIEIAKERAKAQAIRNAREKAGIFIAKDNLNGDKLKTEFVGSLVMVNSVDYKNEVFVSAGLSGSLIALKVVATVKVSIDDDLVNEWLTRDAGDRKVAVENNKVIQDTINKQDEQFYGLKNQSSAVMRPSSNEAEVQTYVGIGDYDMSIRETPETAMSIAKQYAMRNAQEQAGFFIHSHSKMENAKLTEDVIETIATSIIRLENETCDITPSGKGAWHVHAVVTVKIDPNSIERWLNQDAQTQNELVSKLKEMQRLNAELDKKIAALKQADSR